MLKSFYFLIVFVFSSSVVFASVETAQTQLSESASQTDFLENQTYVDESEDEYSDDEFADTELPVEGLQIGATFDRTFLKPGDEENLDVNLKTAALSAAEFGTGSAFYVGQFGGKHIMATNAHVMMTFSDEIEWTAEDYNKNALEACKIYPGEKDSEPKYIRFSLVEKEYNCKRLIGLWPEIDFALFEIEVTDDFDFKGMGVSLKNSKKHFKGQSLAMFSYGIHLNPGSYNFDLAFTQDSLCSVFSEGSKKMQESEGADLYVWSIATGCDISVGDSGSAMIDAETGLFTGIVWAGSADKIGNVQNDDHLKKVLKSDVEDEEMIWTRMNYAVPAQKITAVILSSLDQKKPQDREILEAIFN